MNALHRLLTVPLASLGLVVACGGDGPTSVVDRGMTVSGIVKDRTGEPIGGARVLIPGKDPVMTAPDGRFLFSAVTAPYDVAIFVSSQNRGTVYKGLTRSDPSLLGAVNPTGTEHTATITGTVPPASGKVTAVFFIAGPEVASGAAADPSTGQYTVTVQWHGPTTAYTGSLYVLRWTPAPVTVFPRPLGYDGYASKSLMITAGETLSGNDFLATELTDPPEETIAGTVAVPAEYTLTSRALVVDFGTANLYGTERTPIPSTFDYTAPALSGVTFGVVAGAQEPAGGWSEFFKSGIAGNSTGVVVPLVPAPQLVSPVDNAAAIDTRTVFTWTGGAGAVVNILAAIPDAPADPTFVVFTTASNEKIPDFTWAGVALPAGASYHWQAEKVFPLASIDEAAGEGYLPLVNYRGGDVGLTISERFGFTTKAAAGTALQTPAAGGVRTAVPAVPERLRMSGFRTISANGPSNRRLPW